MEKLQYPNLYISSDEAARVAQSHELRSYKISGILLILGSLCAMLGTATTLTSILSAIFFIGSLAMHLYNKFMNFRSRWYGARALAESIKTATWRLIMGAAPFSNSDSKINLEDYRKLLSELLEQNKEIGKFLSVNDATNEELPRQMEELMHLPYDKKRALYLKNRINDQKRWYSDKAKQNKKSASIITFFVFVAYCVAIVLVFIRIGWPELAFLPINLFAVIASVLVGWKQLRRFDELTSAYSLTAHEVELISFKFSVVSDQEELGNFVSDSENAFSREHTQWAARRDH